MYKMSRVLKLCVLALIVLAFGSIILAACARPGSTSQAPAGGSPTAASGGNSGSSETSVSMNATNFTEKSVTVSKGSSLSLVNSSSVIHIISNGTWESGTTPKPGAEPGAPKVSNMTVATGQTEKVGPFTTAGTFQLFCTVHPGMNLTVIVK